VITELNHVAILVRDRDESVGFYTTVLGGTVVWTARVESIGLDIVYVQSVAASSSCSGCRR
jgi:catechol 2,3-dioxygenase-like lactoylglutathione lyase family enzyme